MAWSKAENDRWLAEKLAELKVIQSRVAATRGPYVASVCGRGGERDMNFATLRDLYVKPYYSDRIVYVDGPGGSSTAFATVGCRDRRHPEYVAETVACAKHLKKLGFRVRAIQGDDTSFRIS